MFEVTHAFPLRPGEPRALRLRELPGPGDSLTLEVQHNGERLGQYSLPMGHPPMSLALGGGALELSCLEVFEKPQLRVRFEGADVPGSAFHPGTHQRKALRRGLTAFAPAAIAAAAAAWKNETSFAFWFGGAALGVLALLPLIRKGVRPALVAAIALTASVSVGCFLLIGSQAFDGLFMVTGLAAYDLLLAFGDRQWMDEARARQLSGTPAT